MERSESMIDFSSLYAGTSTEVGGPRSAYRRQSSPSRRSGGLRESSRRASTSWTRYSPFWRSPVAMTIASTTCRAASRAAAGAIQFIAPTRRGARSREPSLGEHQGRHPARLLVHRSRHSSQRLHAFLAERCKSFGGSEAHPPVLVVEQSGQAVGRAGEADRTRRFGGFRTHLPVLVVQKVCDGSCSARMRKNPEASCRCRAHERRRI